MVVGKMVGCGFGTRCLATTALLHSGSAGDEPDRGVRVHRHEGRLDLGVVSSLLFPIVGTAAGITAFLTPYLIGTSYRIDPAGYSLPSDGASQVTPHR